MLHHLTPTSIAVIRLSLGGYTILVAFFPLLPYFVSDPSIYFVSDNHKIRSEINILSPLSQVTFGYEMKGLIWESLHWNKDIVMSDYLLCQDSCVMVVKENGFSLL